MTFQTGYSIIIVSKETEIPSSLISPTTTNNMQYTKIINLTNENKTQLEIKIKTLTTAQKETIDRTMSEWAEAITEYSQPTSEVK